MISCSKVGKVGAHLGKSLKYISRSLADLSIKTPNGKTKVLVIVGPTAVGKTGLSLELARCVNAELISADSVQVYRGLDIGSDKVSAETRAQVPHHGVDVVSLTERRCSAGDWVRIALAAIQDIAARGRIPVIVGGTWFYLNMLQSGLTHTPKGTDEDEDIVNRQIAERGSFALNHDFLMKIDPVYGRTLTFNDWKKLQRALLIYHISGRPVSSFKPFYQSQECPYDFRGFCLYRPSVSQWEVLAERCDQIVNAGLVEETHWALLNGLDPDGKLVKTIGYRQALTYLRTNWLVDDRPTDLRTQISEFRSFVSKYKVACRSFASHQRRSWKSFSSSYEWLNVSEHSEAALVRRMLERYNAPTLPPPLHSEASAAEIQGTLSAHSNSNEEFSPLLYDNSPIFCDDAAVVRKLSEIQAYLERDSSDLPHPLSLAAVT